MNTKEKSKICNHCKNSIDVKNIKCPNCGKIQGITIIGIILLVIIGIVLVSNVTNKFVQDKTKGDNNYSGNYNNSSNNNYNSNSEVGNNQNDNNINNFEKKSYGFNETFEFDGLEITINENYLFDTVKNRYSDYNNRTAVKLPITVKNISSETHGLNMFYYDIYGSQGTEAEGLDAYFDDTISYSGDLRSGASYTKYMYFLYDGDGTYAIEFDNYSEKVEVEITITK